MKAIGIDLGTTNSVAAFCGVGKREPRVLASRAGENLTPSVVAFRASRTD
jgi:molecular chaperone DnaK (HSP70)